MEIEKAVKIHKEWKIKIGDYLIHPDKSLKPDICTERACELTAWLSSQEANEFLEGRELAEFIKAHKAFHHTLAELVINANRGVEVSEEMALGIDSTFHRHFEIVLKLLSKIKNKNQKSG